MRRRDFIILLASMTAGCPLAARAQQPAMPVVGFLNAGEYALEAASFRQGLSEIGYVEGRNVLVEYRWAEGHYDRLPALAADLVRRQVTAIASGGNAAVLAAKAATTTIPIVFTTGANPVSLGLVTSLSRPGGNLTGVTGLGSELEPKRLELLHELVPVATEFALLVNATNPVLAEPTVRRMEGAARILGLKLHVLAASTEQEIEAAFASLSQLHAGGLVIGADNFFNSRSEQLARLSLRHAVPVIYQYHEFAAAGGLISYGGSLTETYRLVGGYIGRILNGEKPADLPVQQATKVDLIINLKTAKAIGITIPEPLLARADGVIE